MPVRSLTSSVLNWPDREAVDAAVRAWAQRVARPSLLRIDYCGSYARGDWGVGSDVDLLIVVAATDRPALKRALDWDAPDLPVPTDVLVYMGDEWGRFALTPAGRRIAAEAVWVWP